MKNITGFGLNWPRNTQPACGRWMQARRVTSGRWDAANPNVQWQRAKGREHPRG